MEPEPGLAGPALRSMNPVLASREKPAGRLEFVHFSHQLVAPAVLPPVWGRRFRQPTRQLSAGAWSLVILAEAATPVGQPILAAAAFQAALCRTRPLSVSAAWTLLASATISGARRELRRQHPAEAGSQAKGFSTAMPKYFWPAFKSSDQMRLQPPRSAAATIIPS